MDLVKIRVSWAGSAIISGRLFSMKLPSLLVFAALFLAAGCHRPTETASQMSATKGNTIDLDAGIKDTVLRHIHFRSRRHFATFETPAEVRFYTGGVVVDSILDPNFHMMSWYSIYHDTIDLVAHVGEFETQALLVRFLHGTPGVYYFRASHERQKYFRLTKTDSFASSLAIPAKVYHLQLSAIPDSVKNPQVFGSIEMESERFYDQRDPLKTNKVKMKFYFGSQFRSVQDN